MKDTFIKLKKLLNKSYTFLIIPNSTKKVKQIRIPYVLILLISLVIFSSFSFLFVDRLLLINENGNLIAKLNKNKIEAENHKRYSSYLDNTLETQTVTVNNLKTSLNKKRKMYDDKLSQLNELEGQMAEIINEFNYQNNLDVQVAFSRSLTEGRKLIEHADSITNEEIEKLIDLDIEKYNKLMEDIENKMDFVECKPDLIPLKGRITSDFGYRRHPITGRWTMHDGLDISGDIGDKIVASGSGIVTYAGWDGNYGKIIIISHGYGYKSIYAHNSKLLVDKGETIKKGQIISEVGNTGRSTGPHVHFEVHKDYKRIDPEKLIN